MNELRIDAGNTKILVSGDYHLQIKDNIINIFSGTIGDIDEEIKPLTTPKTAPEHEQLKKPYYDQERLRSGSEALYGLVETWKIGFDIQGAEQPDRVEALRTCIAHNGDQLLLFLRYSKGLTTAILNLFPPLPAAEEIQKVDHSKSIRKLACNIAQVSSLVAPEISDFLEPHSNYLKQKFYW